MKDAVEVIIIAVLVAGICCAFALIALTGMGVITWDFR